MAVESGYNLELERAISTIKEQKAKLVLVQLPDGLKKIATDIVEEIESKTQAQCLVWMGSCFGACDVPQGLEKLGVDLIIQWGHSAWPYKKEFEVLR